ncbi:hypothetical protein HNQ91_002246 [Filimonas zeae]|uniref:Uncharacterized protein n=1 Tax=Filimonas zeae TaxID=1737353 RepID=A0A917IUY3_9BACT|nr:hypothetical protein [Filimonas zeae]MDR6339195.1 hypothetical protein [Filimonas zeae]GGH64666.1 hypothetical protein GCM10011379_16970 [Filimonas zeae]
MTKAASLLLFGLLLYNIGHSQTLTDVTTAAGSNVTGNAIKINGSNNFPTGSEGLELYFSSGVSRINSLNRTTTARFPLEFNASTFNFISNRPYFLNRTIPGSTEDSQGPNYLLLHKMYTGTLMPESYVMGRISAIRGGVSAGNRKISVEVNTATAYNFNRGSIMSHFEAQRLVSLTYNNETYLALEFLNNSTVYSLSFTGYASGESFALLRDEDVTNVQEFVPTDAINVQGRLSLGYFGGGAPVSRFHMIENVAARDNFITVHNTSNTNSRLVAGTAGTSYAVTNHAGSSVVESYNDLHLSAAIAGNIYFETGRTGTTSPVRMKLTNNGTLVIGTETVPTGYKLAVNGAALFTKIVVKPYDKWPDYIFDSSYRLTPLPQLEQYIQQHKHLPDVPSAAVVEKEGIDMGSNQAALLKKIEELTLYIISQHKELNNQKQAQAAEKQALENNNKLLEQRLQTLEQKLNNLLKQ